MKLLMISGDRTLSAGKAGAFSETLSELHRHFERIDIICPASTADQQVRSLLGNVYLHPASGGLLSQPSFIVNKGKELIAAHQHDVMTVHDYPPFYNGRGAAKLRKITGIPAAYEIHHIVGFPKAASVSEWIGRLLSRRMLPMYARQFDAVRVVNRTVADTLVSWGVEADRIKLVPSLYLDQELIASVRNQPKTTDLAFCARLVPNKGLLPLIDAVSRLPEVTLTVIGDGPVRAAAEERVRAKGLSGRIVFTGWLGSHEEVLNKVASAKIFVMNSLSEGGPRSAAEAMALGLPVVTTKVGVMPDLVQDGAQGVFTDGTARDLSAAIQNLLKNPSLPEMGRRAAKDVAHYSKSVAIGAYARFIMSIAGRKV